MLEALKKMFGIGPKADFKELIKNGAVIIDVRSKGEFQGGHIRGAINIPLDRIQSEASKLKKDKAIITCCASGMRSSSAKSLLQAKGFEVYNGGGWSSLNSKLN